MALPHDVQQKLIDFVYLGFTPDESGTRGMFTKRIGRLDGLRLNLFVLRSAASRIEQELAQTERPLGRPKGVK
jgi:hypothetical protein